MIKRFLITFVFMSMSSITLADSGFFVSPKLGFVSWSERVYTISGNTITFDDTAQVALGVEGGYLFDFGTAITAEILGSSVEADNETAGANRGTASAAGFTALATQYFRRDHDVQPYIGVGIGSYGIEIDESNTNVTLDGYSTQLRIGTLINISEHVSLNVEFKRFRFNVDDEVNNEMKSTANFIGGGAMIKF